MRLPRSHPRRLHGRTRPRGPGHGLRHRQGPHPQLRQGPLLRAGPGRPHGQAHRVGPAEVHRLLPGAAEFADLHFIGVGTPQQPGTDAYDLSHLFDAVRQLAPGLARPAVVAVKPTVPVGTAPCVAELLREHAPARDLIEVAWNPEFLRESFAVEDTLRPDRLVLGFSTTHSWAEALLRQAFGKIIESGTPTIVTDWATAELAKGAANSFLATAISFINAMAEVCEKSGANVAELADILGHDIRIGRRGMRPGLGFGGGCLPKDLGGFITRADELDADKAVGMLREAGAVNARRRQRVIDLAREELGTDLRGKRITG